MGQHGETCLNSCSNLPTYCEPFALSVFLPGLTKLSNGTRPGTAGTTGTAGTMGGRMATSELRGVTSSGEDMRRPGRSEATKMNNDCYDNCITLQIIMFLNPDVLEKDFAQPVRIWGLLRVPRLKTKSFPKCGG